MLNLKSGLKYPWGDPKKMLNILWVLIPLFGWFALWGYGKRIINSIVKGNTKKLPAFGRVWDNFVVGIMLFLKILPLMIVLGAFNFLLDSISNIGIIYWILWPVYIAFLILIMPWIGINLMEKYTVASTFEFNTALKIVFGNFADYLTAIARTIIYVIIYLILSLVIIGIPCIAFGQRLFIADFYARAKK